MSRKLSMTQRVVDQLREDIINWKYEENNIITETEIAKAFDVSKTPAREALTTLCMEGFLEKLPNKGYLVKGSGSRKEYVTGSGKIFKLSKS